MPRLALLGLLAAEETKESILSGYPYLEPGDIDEALRRLAAFGAEHDRVAHADDGEQRAPPYRRMNVR
jgi:uncharacterized protein (DUF433 family)